MGRPKLYDKPRVCTAVRLPIDLREELETVADERDVSMNRLVTEAITQYLSQLTSIDDLVLTKPSSEETSQGGVDG